ncbi:MAG TPA: YciI family protein [Baekduia sp.]|uniref:YciI family protein n=1 Tax=Baekduia sp. TaxID=2600305 RepID=UPI002D776A51|nr:YciI family protein [Baekduia sp.]HET6510476.1 YciI family protein [Baekduia sp.]
MRYMMFMKVDEAVYERDPAGETEAYAAMGRYNEELTKAGVLLALDGLQPPSAGARIEFGEGGATVVDGPFAEAKEVVGGYWIIDVRSHDEAVEWARRVPARKGEAIELRPIFEAGDYDPAALEAHGELSSAPPRQTTSASEA